MAHITMELNSDDHRILSLLQTDGRISTVEMARRAHMSETTCLRRTRALEAAGIIRGYHADIDFEAAGFGVMAFIQVTIDQRIEAGSDSFKDAILRENWVLECYSLSGAYDHLMKVIAPDNKALSDFILKRLAGYKSVRDFQTLFVLDTVKEGQAVRFGEG
jgi:Lrp/AsnC family leucine-responsive transcriptional regulator